MKRQFISLLLISFMFTNVAIAQKKPVKDSIPKTTDSIPKITDSTVIFSLKDIDTFNSLLKKVVSYGDYIKLTPEVVLQQLISWKLEAMKPKK